MESCPGNPWAFFLVLIDQAKKCIWMLFFWIEQWCNGCNDALLQAEI